LVGSPPKRTFTVLSGPWKSSAFVGFFLAFFVVRRPWVWRVLECSPELVALLGGVVSLQMPRALLF
jgi:hypothetical protein